jgi:integrase/recombinase XerC
MASSSRLPGGAAELMVVGGSPLLRPEEQVFEAMLSGWPDQQLSRNLALATVEDRGGPRSQLTRRYRMCVASGE